jgi:hypothetical protein
VVGSESLGSITAANFFEQHIAYMGEFRNAYKILVRKPEAKRLLRRPRHRWEDYIRWILGKWVGKVWTRCTWLRTGTSGRLL